LNAVNQQTPTGSVTYQPTGNVTVDGNVVPQWTQTTTLSPEQQALYNSATGLKQGALDTAQTGLSNVQNTLATPFSLTGLPPTVSGVSEPGAQTGYNQASPQFQPNATTAPLQTNLGDPGQLQRSLDNSNLPGLPGANDFSAERQRVEDAYLGRFNQDIANQQADTESRLNAEGLQRGSAAWNNAQDALNRERVDARNAAIQAGGAEQSRLFGLASQARGQLFGENLAGGQFGNQAQQQAFQQLLGSGVFGNQANQQQFGQNQALQDAFNRAAAQYTGQNQTMAGFFNTAQGQQFQQALQNAALQNQSRQQGIAEQSLVRSQPINELATLLGLGGQVQQPTGAPNFGIGIAPTDVLGAYGLANQAQQNAYNAQVANQTSNNQAAAGLGSAALMALLLA
jgi:hypothetical protein